MLEKDEKEILKELREIQKSNENWKDNIDNVAAKLNENYSVNVKAKALWILGEMGLRYPQQLELHIERIVGLKMTIRNYAKDQSMHWEELEEQMKS